MKKKRIKIIGVLIIMMLSLFNVIPDVGPDGAFNYAIPINVPPGTAGIAPVLSLVYSSMGDNGIEGVGWQLSGLDVISLDPRYPIGLGQGDHFMYNGQKLIQGADGYYHTEKEGYLRIDLKDYGTSTSYWIIMDKNGVKRYYGNTDDSRIVAAGTGGKIRAWALNKVIDLMGNYYVIKYDQYNGAFYPRRIIYTFNDNGSLSKYRTVKLDYDTSIRPDPIAKSIPTFITINYRLLGISVYVNTNSIGDNGTLLRKYELGYTCDSTTNNRSFLTSFKEYGSDGTSYLPVQTFKYSPNGMIYYSLINDSDNIRNGNYQNVRLDPMYFFNGDFNGDGKEDILLQTFLDGWKVNFGGNGTTFTMLPTGNGLELSPCDGFSDYPRDNVRIGDFNGDGKSDFMIYKTNYTWWINISDGDGTFTTTEYNAGTYYMPATSWNDQNYVVLGDFDNDARTDFVTLGDHVFYTHLSLGNGNFDKKTSSGFSGTHFSEVGSVYKRNHLNAADFNGDGKDDLLYYYKSYSVSSEGIITYDNHLSIFLSNGTGNYNRWGDISTHNSGIDDLNDLRIADFDGNGNMDFMLKTSSNYNWDIYFSTYSYSFPIVIFTTVNVTFPAYEDNLRGHFNIGDFNGDGLTDLMIWKGWSDSTNWYVCLSKGNGTFTQNTYGPIAYPVIYDEETFTEAAFRYADFDGDGMTDLLIWSELYDQYVYMYLSKGDGSFTNYNENGNQLKFRINTDYNSAYTWKLTAYNLIIMDFKGFGKKSVMAENDPSGINIGKWDILFPSTAGYDNGAGTTNASNLMVDMDNGRGGKIYIAYKPAPMMDGAVDPTYSVYKIISDSSSRNLVSRVLTRTKPYPTLDSGLKYEYEDGRYLTGGKFERRYLGFAKIRTTSYTGLITDTYYCQSFPYDGLINSIKTYDNNTTHKLLTETKYNYMYRHDPTGGNDIYFVYRLYEVLYNYNGESTPLIYKTYYTYTDGGNGSGDYDSYDDYGSNLFIRNLGRVTESNGVYTNVTTRDDTGTVLEYAKNTSLYFMKIYSQTTYGCDKDGVWGMATQSVKYFDNLNTIGEIGNYGLVTKTQAYDGTGWITGKFSYDSWGNCTDTYDARYNAGEYGTPSPNYTTHTVYDSDYKTLVTSTTDAFGYTASISYLPDSSYNQEAPYGINMFRPYYATDANGVKAYTNYDVFGNPVNTILPGDSYSYPTTKTIYDYTTVVGNTTAIPSCVMVNDGSSGDGYLRSYTFSDGLGRVIQTKTEMAGSGEFSTVDMYYDNEGRQYKTSMPYKVAYQSFEAIYTDREANTGSKKYTITEFDNAGRPYKTTFPDGTYTETVYMKIATGVWDRSGHYTVTATVLDNNKGVIEKAKEYTGTGTNVTLYATTETRAYRGGTEVKDDKAINDERRITSTVVDMLGRKTSIITPDMGTWSFTYDGNGNKKTETDAKGQVIKYVYDKLNRLITIDYPTGTDTQYYYDGDDNRDGTRERSGMIGKLTKAVYADGQEVYTYDNRGRLTKQEVTIAGVTKTEEYTYDVMNRVKTTKLPDGEVITNNYGCDGRLYIMLGNSNYIKSILYNELGAPTEMTYGNDVKTYYDYYDTSGETDPDNDDSGPDSALTYTYRLKRMYTSTSSILDLVYQYDKDGNIKVKTDANSSYGSASYNYDDIDRLILANWSGGDRTYEYDTVGNITKKEGRSYTYRSGTNQVLYDGTNGYTYDKNGNIIFKCPGNNSLRIQRVPGTYYNTLQDAYDNAQNNDVIQGKVGTIGGDIVPVSGKNVSISGGYDSGWASVTGKTTFVGNIANANARLVYSNSILNAGGISGSGLTKYTYDYNNMLLTMTTAGGEYYTYSYFGESRVKKTEGGVTTRYFFGDYVEETNSSTTTLTKYYAGFAQYTSSDSKLRYIYDDKSGSSTVMTEGTSTTVVKRITYSPYGTVINDSASSIKLRYTFTGQEMDASGMYYLGARYYDPVIGRFITADSADTPPGTPQSLNRYSYCANNPVNYSDPSGHSYIDWDSFGDNFGGTFNYFYDNLKSINKVMLKPLDWIGIREMKFGLYYGYGGEARLNASTGDFGFGVGGGYGITAGITHKYADIGGTCGYYAALGYNSAGNTVYVATGFGYCAGAGSMEMGYSFDYGELYENASFSYMGVGVHYSISSGGGFDYGFSGTYAGFSGSWSKMGGLNIGYMAGSQYGNGVGINYNVKNGQFRGAVSIAVCFVAGTKIKTEDGYKNIEDIEIGDKVLSMNEETGEFTYKEVVRTFTNETNEIVRIKIGDEVIECTPEHPFWVASESLELGIKSSELEVQFVGYMEDIPEKDNEGIWIEAKNLKAGMKVLSADRRWMEIFDIDLIKRYEKTYNFEVADWHTYCVSNKNVVVHNECDKKTGKCTESDQQVARSNARDVVAVIVTTAVGWFSKSFGATVLTGLSFWWWTKHDNLRGYELSLLDLKEKFSTDVGKNNLTTYWMPNGNLVNVCNYNEVYGNRSPRPGLMPWQISEIESMGRKMDQEKYFRGGWGASYCPSVPPVSGSRPTGTSAPPRK